MQCPKCGFTQADGLAECQACQIIFARWQARAAAPPPPAVQPQIAPDPADPATADDELIQWSQPGADLAAKPAAALNPALAVIQMGVVFFVCLIFAAWLYLPRGLAVPAGAIENKVNGFAVAAPADWLMLTPENLAELMERFGGQLPAVFREAVQSKQAAVAYFKLPDGNEFSPSFNVVVIKGNLPRLTAATQQEAAKEISGAAKKAFDEFEVQDTRIITVDKLASLRLSSRAAQKVKTAEAVYNTQPGAFYGTVRRELVSPARWENVELYFEQTVVPGKDKAYILTCTLSAAQTESARPECEKMVNSFRVLSRPKRFGPVLMGALSGALLGAAAYLIKALTDLFLK